MPLASGWNSTETTRASPSAPLGMCQRASAPARCPSWRVHRDDVRGHLARGQDVGHVEQVGQGRRNGAARQFAEADEVEFGERALSENGCRHEALQLNATPPVAVEEQAKSLPRGVVPGGQWFAQQERR